MKSVLYISYDGMTDNLGQSQVIPYLIGLQKHGYLIHILSCEKPDRFAAKKREIYSLLSQHNIYWHPVPYTAEPPILSTMNDIRILKLRASILLKKYSVDFLHCRSYISAFVGLYMQKKYNIPWIFDMRGFWADERVDGGIWDLNKTAFNQVYNYFKRKEKTFLKKANHIISLTENAKTEIQSWEFFKKTNNTITVIPCCADLDFFNHSTISQRDTLSIRENFSIPNNAFVLSYLGSFGTWYMTNEMFDFFAELYAQNSESIFLCITPDSKDWLLELAQKRNIPQSALRVVSASRKEVAGLISVSDWSIFFIKPVFSKKASSPTKMGEIMGMGIPIICNSGVGDVDAIMKDTNAGILLENLNKDTYQDTVSQILKNKTFNKETLYQASCKYYSLQEGIQRYKRVYEAIKL